MIPFVYGILIQRKHFSGWEKYCISGGRRREVYKGCGVNGDCYRKIGENEKSHLKSKRLSCIIYLERLSELKFPIALRKINRLNKN